MHHFYSALIAGVMTGLGGAAYLGAENREVGALLFSIGMFAALAMGLPLYTGRCAGAICHKPHNTKAMLMILTGNLLGAVLCGLLFGYAVTTGVPQLQESKLAQPFLSTLIRGTFCGMIIFAGVQSWKSLQSSKPLGTLLGVTAFVVAGFENSVADAFYFSAALGQGVVFDARVPAFLAAAILGNTLGAVLLCLAMPPFSEKTEQPA